MFDERVNVDCINANIYSSPRIIDKKQHNPPVIFTRTSSQKPVINMCNLGAHGYAILGPVRPACVKCGCMSVLYGVNGWRILWYMQVKDDGA